MLEGAGMCVELILLPLILDRYMSRFCVNPRFSRFLRSIGTVPSGPFSTPSMASSGIAFVTLCPASCNSRFVAAAGGGLAMVPCDSTGIQSIIWPLGVVVVLTMVNSSCRRLK